MNLYWRIFRGSEANLFRARVLLAALGLTALASTGEGTVVYGQDSLYESDRYAEEYEYGVGYDVDAYDEIPDFNSPNSLYSPSSRSRYGYVSDATSQFQVGSDAFLDASTSPEYEAQFSQRFTVEDNYVGSGLGKRPKKKPSTGLFGMPVENDSRDGDTFYERWIEPDVSSEGWTKQVLPVGLMYPSYLASRKDPRLSSIITYERDYGTLWDITLGGRAPIFRFGTNDVVQPEGWEIELEGAALLRLDWERRRELAGTDYRAGVPIVYGTRRWQFKTGYYHVSSHLGDNYILGNFRTRKHYVRDSVMFGISFKPISDVRLYAELDYAFHYDKKTTDPIELQFGFEYAPQFNPTRSNWVARPFLASHGHLYQERDFGGYWATQAGLQWRSPTNSMLRLGAEFYLGGDELYQFHTTYQRKVGGGIWYDF